MKKIIIFGAATGGREVAAQILNNRLGGGV